MRKQLLADEVRQSQSQLRPNCVDLSVFSTLCVLNSSIDWSLAHFDLLSSCSDIETRDSVDADKMYQTYCSWLWKSVKKTQQSSFNRRTIKAQITRQVRKYGAVDR